MKWSEDLCTGIAVIDRQHKTFFKLTNDLLEGSENDKKLILKAFDFLKNYIAEHFGLEEKLMVDYKYPAIKQHKTFHDNFIAELDKLEPRLQEESLEPVFLRLNYLVVNWFVNHISTKDKKLASFLESQALKDKSVSAVLKRLHENSI
ncbi:MAG: hypothetical protein A2X45_01715 [Lentisphaerae bacterium GWF2_50_93]|nr:MAG: hypothetical protein A2X45_01715 [Lentisphaerae bacterium GWF2_50_93]